MKTAICLFFLILSLSACDHFHGDKEIEMDPQALKKGPGIFTGRTGEWRIIGR